MQIKVTVLGPGVADGVDVSIAAPGGTQLSAVLGSLASAVSPGGATPGAVFCEDRRLDPAQTPLGQPPLVDGAVLSLHRPLDGPGAEPVPARLLVASGPDAGGVHLLRGGTATIGRSADADIPLDDPDVSRLHCALTLGADGAITVADLGSTNGTSLDGRPVRERPVAVPPGGILRLGESALRVLTDERQPAAGGPPPAAGAAPSPPPAADADGRAARRAGWARGRRGPVAEPAGAPAPPAPGAGGPVARPSAADESRWPDLAALLLLAVESGPRLWERGPDSPDAYGIRLGTAPSPADGLVPVTVSLPAVGSLGLAGPRERIAGLARAVLAQLAALQPPSALELVVLAPGRAAEWSWLGWLPHTRPARGQDCRLLLGFDDEQVAARLAELAELTAAPAGGAPRRRSVVLVDGPLAGAAGQAVARLAADGPAAGVHLLCLAETPPATPSSPVASTLAAARAAAPAFAACGAVGLLSGAVATAVRLVGPDDSPGPPASADAVSPAWAERFARALAPLREERVGGGAGPAAQPGAPLPESCRLLDVLELSRVTPGALRERWAAGTELPLTLGAGERGPVTLGLAALGGPLLVEGGSRAGRTESLNALAASLAATLGPRELSLLLVEGAGEGLAPSAELPQVASYLTATDPLRIRAFAQALRAELKRRALLLGGSDFVARRLAAEAAGAGLAEAALAGGEAAEGRVVAPRSGGEPVGWAAREAAVPEPPMRAEGSAPLPWLVVLVDDLPALLAPPLGAPGRQSAGSMLRALDAVRREGQALGVRLVLAGARPTVEDPLRLASATRLSLTGTPPGRGELWAPDGARTPVQVGRITGRIPRTATLRPTVTRLDWARLGDPPARRPVRELGNGPTDIALLASAAARAARTREAAPATPV
ncbi:FHA domain-containing protein [Streptomyces sp. DSM 44915]|uniref:FHA domain-containing protein n=1 Tax=Streptomyces chisholmiae TaxID=3075540 RepID=A0ABU2JS70_9ACTN|nr:FHA domain-containing protein [Streptomyces sp. DSM 44915]MDT0267839.1 FHA domain-containing protein [Streptomyces sp. DSM 44915]